MTCADALVLGLRDGGDEVDVVGASTPRQTAWTGTVLERVEQAVTSRSYDVVLAFHAFWPFTADCERSTRRRLCRPRCGTCSPKWWNSTPVERRTIPSERPSDGEPGRLTSICPWRVAGGDPEPRPGVSSRRYCARTAFAGIRPEDEPPWTYYYDEAFLESHFSVVYLALGRPAPARQATERSLERLDPSMVRDRAGHLGRLAETYAHDGEVHETCRLAGEAIDMATGIQFDGAVVRVRMVRELLEPWSSEPAVRDLDEQLAGVAAWVHSTSAYC